MSYSLITRFEDRLSFLYLEFGTISKEDHEIRFSNETQVIQIPCGYLALLILGPGTVITHAAVKEIISSNCSILWSGKDYSKIYSFAAPSTSSSKNLMKQVDCFSNRNLEIARELFFLRFGKNLESSISIEALRGKEGLLMKQAYKDLSKIFNVDWQGRKVFSCSWEDLDFTNQCISIGNSILYGICGTAITTIGMSPSLGFIHSGHINSFVFDIADIYKVEYTLPIIFECLSKLEGTSFKIIRTKLREMFRERKLLEKIISDIQRIIT